MLCYILCLLCMYLLYQFIVCLNIYICIILRMYNLICSSKLHFKKNNIFCHLLAGFSNAGTMLIYLYINNSSQSAPNMLSTCRTCLGYEYWDKKHSLLLAKRTLQKITHPKPKKQNTKNPITL